MAQVGLTVRRQCQADTKVEHSEPTLCIRCRGRLSDKSYSRDNRLVPPKSPYRRRSSAPRCRLDLSWGWRRSQGFGCSPIKKSRELGSDRVGPNLQRIKILKMPCTGPYVVRAEQLASRQECVHFLKLL